MLNVEEIFCKVDDFWKEFEPEIKKRQVQGGKRMRDRKGKLSKSEIMTIMIIFHDSCHRHFKGYYENFVCQYLRKDFPDLVSYPRFVALMKSVLLPLCAYLNSNRGKQTGIAFVDSTSIAVCHNRRIRRHKVFRDLAKRGKTTMGWFFGFKLHLAVNDKGEILSFYLSPGDLDDRAALPKLTKDLFGKLFGDRGYISQAIFESLLKRGLQLITNVRSNMKNKLLQTYDKLLLRKRFIIETINDQLKNISQIEHSRHRSPTNFLVNLISGLLAYSFQPKKPSLNLSNKNLALLIHN